MPASNFTRQVANPVVLPTIVNRFSQAMTCGPLVFLAGMIASDFETGLAPEVKQPPGLPYQSNATRLQAEFLLRRQQQVAEGAGTSLDRAVQTWSFLTDIRHNAAVLEARHAVFGTAPMPAATAFGVRSLTVAEGTIEIDAILAAPGVDWEVIACRSLPPIPPEFGMSRAVRVGPYVFVSSIAAVDYSVGLAPDARVAAGFPFFESGMKKQTAHILRTLKTILEDAGSALDQVVKAQVTMPDLTGFAEFEEVWQEAFPAAPPARSIIPAQLTIPGCLVEVNAIAIIPDGTIRKETLHTPRAPTPCIHEPQAVKAGPFIFLSQLMATDYKHGLAPQARVDPQFPNHDSPVRRELAYIYENADAILETAGSSLKSLVRRQGFYTRFDRNLPAARGVTLDRFQPAPSPSAQVELGAGLLVPACRYLFDVIGVPA